MEEGFMLYFPERMAAGDVANVDFLHLYGPGSLQVLRWWYEVFGNSLRAERTFGLLQHLGILFGLFALARAWGRAAATCVAALAVFYILTPVALPAMAWNGGLALTLWAAVFALRGINLEDPSRRRRAWVVAGVLGGLALSYRPDLVIAVGLVLGVVLAWREQAARRPVLLGLVVGLVPMWIHLVQAGPRAAVRGMLIDPVFHLRAGRELPRPPTWNRLDGALQGVAEEIPPWWRLPHLAASNALFLWFCVMVLGTLALLGYAIWRRRSGDRSGRSLVLLGVALISIGILPQGLQRPDSAHLLWVTCVSWPFAVVVGTDLVAGWRPRIEPRRALLAGTGFALVLTFAFTSLFTFRYYLLHTRVGLGQLPSAFPVRRGDRYFYLGDYRAFLAMQAAADQLSASATPGERLFVGPSDLRRTWYSDVFFYWLFPELDPATYFIEMDPGLANKEGSRLASDVPSADWILLSGLWDGWFEPNASIEYGSDAPNQVIRDQFCEVGNYEEGLAVLYHRCA